jgi:transcriptional regulator with XRE-family HTH domain
LIRQKGGKTQAEFADILKIGRSTLTNLENGITIFTDKNVNMVCLAFNVNETWLKTGIWEMFTP